MPGRIFAGDEELGKKNDDHKPIEGGASPFARLIWRAPWRVRRRRLIILITALLALYFFIKYIPTDLGPASNRGTSGGYHRPVAGWSTAGPFTPPTGPPPRDDAQRTDVEKHYFSGPIRFYKLAISLHSIANTRGYRLNNKNVLFAASNLKSASVMIPMACEMGRWRRNLVHFVIMGRDDIAINKIKEVNGVTADCDVHWHGTEITFPDV